MLLGPQFLQSERRISSQNFRHLRGHCCHNCCCYGCCKIAWGLQQQKNEKKKETPPSLQTIGDAFLLLRSEREGFSSSSCLPSEFLAAFVSRLEFTERGETENSLPVCSSLNTGILPCSTCYHLLFRILRQLVHAYYPEFSVAFSGKVVYT